MDSAEGNSQNGISTLISGSFKQISTFPYSSNPETAPNKMLNSDVPGTYIFPLNAGKHVHITLLIIFLITPSLDCQATKVCKCKLIGLACESLRLRGETVPASCN